MSHDPFDMPNPLGQRTLADNLDKGALFEHVDGETYSFRGVLAPDGRWSMVSLGDNPRPLMFPDAITGFPAYPTQDQVLEAMASGKLHHVSSPLDSPVRNRARGSERTRSEVTSKDPYAEVRMMICRAWDKERPAKDDCSLEQWRDKRFDWDHLESKFSRERPPASTMRAWINKRGRPGNRCWADMENCKGQGPRAPRVTGHRLAIAMWHAVAYCTNRRHATVSKLWKDVEADTEGYNTGKPLIMHDFVRVWPKPDEPIKPADKEFFRQLVKRLESPVSYKWRWSNAAAQQRWEGGGSAPEPVMFLEIVQQDDTQVPGFFWINAIQRVPLGLATWVLTVDIYTRCILAWDLSFDTPSTINWMRNIVSASKYKNVPKEYAERFPALRTIGGRISSIIYDNASHLIGRAVEDAHGDLVQDVIFAGEGQGTHKAVVEGIHDTLRSLFIAELPGAKMQIYLAREFNMDPSQDTQLLTLEEGRRAMDRAVCKYHLEVKGDDGRVPLDRWVEQWNLHGPRHAKDQEQFERAIGNVTLDLVLDNGGIVNEGIEYSDRQLTPLLMEAYARTTHHRRRRKKPAFNVKVKWDPTDMSHISVFDPLAMQYRKVPAKKQRYTAGLTLSMHKLIKRYRGATSLLASPNGEAKLLELRRLAEQEVRRICPKLELREKRARAAIMEQPVLRDIMRADITLLEVDPSASGLEVKYDLGFDRKDMLETAVRGQRGSKRSQAHQQTSDADDIELLATSGFAENDASHDAVEVVAETAGGATREAGSSHQPNFDDDDDDVLSTFSKY